MLIPLDKLRYFYDRILQNALDADLKGANTVQIFVSNETDSLCALKIITVSVHVQWDYYGLYIISVYKLLL